MNKRWLWVILGAFALVLTLILGAVTGGAIVYAILQTRPVQAAALNLNEVSRDQGILIAEVDEDGPAAKAGLVRGDILLEINGKTVNNLGELEQILDERKPEETIPVKVLHGYEIRTVQLTVGEQNGRAYLGIVPCLPARLGVLNLDLIGKQGARIVQVIPNSPADRVGLKVGDLIIAVEGQEINAKNDLKDIISGYKPNDRVTLTVQSPGEETREVTVTLGENPDQPGKAYLGIHYTLAPQWDVEGEELPFEVPFPPYGRFRFTWPELPEGITQGVLIGKVDPDSPADLAGLQPGDVITAVNDEPIKTPRGLSKAIQRYKPGDEVSLTVYRSGEQEPLTINVTLGEDPKKAGRVYLGVTVSGYFFNFQKEGNFPPDITIPNPFFFEFEDEPCPECSSGGTL